MDVTAPGRAVLAHRCRYAVIVEIDDLGVWRYLNLADGRCPRCRRRVTRRSLAPVGFRPVAYATGGDR